MVHEQYLPENHQLHQIQKYKHNISKIRQAHFLKISREQFTRSNVKQNATSGYCITVLLLSSVATDGITNNMGDNVSTSTAETSLKTANVSSATATFKLWRAPTFQNLQLVQPLREEHLRYRLFQLTEIGEGHANAYRLAMANVMSGLDDPQCRAIYILSGTPSGIDLYFGIASNTRTDTELTEMAKTLQTSFEGNFLGANLIGIRKGNPAIDRIQTATKHLGLISGVPSFNDDEARSVEEDFQGIERLANSLVGETWQLVIVAEPGDDLAISDTLDRIYDFSTDISSQLKKSIQKSENTSWSATKTNVMSVSDTHGSNVNDTRGKNDGASDTKSNNKSSSSSLSTNDSQTKNWGTSISKSKSSSNSKTNDTSDSQALGKSGGSSLVYTSDRTDKRVEEIQKHIGESLIPRFQQGRSKGMFRTAIYVCGNTASTYDRLTRNVLSIFQGNAATMTPLRAEKLTNRKVGLPMQIYQYNWQPESSQRDLVYSMPLHTEAHRLSGSTWLTTRELALVAGLPTKELPGLKIRKSVDFALNTSTPSCANSADDALTLGSIIQHGRKLEHSPVLLPKADLNKHVFVTGVTGAGKTTTCMKLLLESGMPFMVIEPAKTEYRALHAQDKNIEYYVLGREDLTPFRLNPFELVSERENLSGHISVLNATLGAVFPMEASMPYLVEEAIIKAYKNKGWDVHGNTNYLMDDPWVEGSDAWPTFGDMIALLDDIIKSKGMGREFEEKYRGSLVSRLSNLTLGTKGRMLNTRHSLDFDKLLDKKVVIELDELKDEQDKALFMGLILSRLAESMKHRHRKEPTFRHLTLIEEAHRLLTRPEPGDPGSKKLGVETFANLLSEVRKYGEGLIIADQIPNKLVSDVIKNTHTKIVHRLFSADDRNTIGDAMGLSDKQKDFLPLLQTGETIMYCGGWHAAVRVQVGQSTNTTSTNIPEDHIQAKGMDQIWLQRRRLYPELSNREAMKNGETLAHFVKDGVKLLNMMLAIKPVLNAPSKNENLANRVQIRYAKSYQTLQDHFEIDTAGLAKLLAALFLDTCGLNSSERTRALFLKILPSALESLSVGVGSFSNYYKDKTTKGEVHALFEDPHFKNLESI